MVEKLFLQHKLQQQQGGRNECANDFTPGLGAKASQHTQPRKSGVNLRPVKSQGEYPGLVVQGVNASCVSRSIRMYLLWYLNAMNATMFPMFPMFPYIPSFTTPHPSLCNPSNDRREEVRSN